MWKGISANSPDKRPADRYHQIARRVLSYHGTRYFQTQDQIIPGEALQQMPYETELRRS